jgi:hypothetical protein
MLNSKAFLVGPVEMTSSSDSTSSSIPKDSIISSNHCFNLFGGSMADGTEKETNEASSSQSQATSETPRTNVKERKRVTFGDLEIRKYPMTIGDHPDCYNGIPVSLGWDYDEKSSIKLSVSEWERRRSPRRNGEALLLTWRHRETIVVRAKCGLKEIRRIERETSRVRRQRERTIRSVQSQKRLQTFVQGVRRILLRLPSRLARRRQNQ